MPTSVESETSNTVKAGLQEIFSSIQGEGLYVGKRQIFVRFNACHLKCVYCDTPQRPAALQCEIEPTSGAEQKVLLENPLSVPQVLDWIQQLAATTRHHSISFTGGEPLLYTEFLKELLPQVTPLLPVYLETSGTQPQKLLEILPWVNIIAMDIKLPSATGEPIQVENHQAFFQLSRERDLFIKLVFAESTTVEELAPVLTIVTDKTIPIFLQPMTDLITGENTVTAARIFELESFLSRHFEDVRVVPQTHKMLSLL
jgi:7-carboxy-7-deazaguanine synthase